MQPVFHVQLDCESFVGNNIYFFRIKRHQFTAACRQRYWALYEGLSVTERLVVEILMIILKKFRENLILSPL